MTVRGGKLEVGHLQRGNSDSHWGISDKSKPVKYIKSTICKNAPDPITCLIYFNPELTLELCSHTDLSISELGHTLLLHTLKNEVAVFFSAFYKIHKPQIYLHFWIPNTQWGQRGARTRGKIQWQYNFPVHDCKQNWSVGECRTEIIYV